jgi:uncharacterized protein
MQQTTPFHVLAKPTGSECNLACDYCFFRQKSDLYPSQRQRMSDTMLDLYIRQLFEAARGEPVAVAWQGGEPTLMGIDFFRRSVRLAEEYREPGQDVLHTIQTNGTLIDDEWAAFLGEHRFLVGVSIDGPAEVHDAYRRDPLGRPTHARVLAGIERLQAPAAEWNALVTIHRASEGRGVDVYRFLRNEAGAEYVQFIPIVERPSERGVPYGEAVTDRSIGAAAYGDFMLDVFDEWVRRDIGRVFVQSFDAALSAWAGEGSPLCVHAAECGRALALEFNGDVYSCDHFVEPEHLLGNIRDTALGELSCDERQRTFGRAKRERLPLACETCDVALACHGGCPKDRFVSGSADGPPVNYLCNGYRRFFRGIEAPMRRMAELLRQGLAPAQFMSELAAREAAFTLALRTAGRNDPCPCGSGRKTKRCHGRATLA